MGIPTSISIGMELEVPDSIYLEVRSSSQAEGLAKFILGSTVIHIVYKFDFEPSTDWESFILDRPPPGGL